MLSQQPNLFQSLELSNRDMQRLTQLASLKGPAKQKLADAIQKDITRLYLSADFARRQWKNRLFADTTAAYAALLDTAYRRAVSPLEPPLEWELPKDLNPHLWRVRCDEPQFQF